MCLKQENPTRVIVISVSLSWNSFPTSVSDLCSFDTFRISWEIKKNVLIVSSRQTLASSKCVFCTESKYIYCKVFFFRMCFVLTLPYDPNSYPISNFSRQISQSNDFVLTQNDDVQTLSHYFEIRTLFRQRRKRASIISWKDPSKFRHRLWQFLNRKYGRNLENACWWYHNNRIGSHISHHVICLPSNHLSVSICIYIYFFFHKINFSLFWFLDYLQSKWCTIKTVICIRCHFDNLPRECC